MFVMSVVSLTIMAAGFDADDMIFAAAHIIFFGTIPILGVVTLFHCIERWCGKAGMISVAVVGLAPAAFVFIVAPAIGVKGNANNFALTLCIAGLLWSAAWVSTSKWKIFGGIEVAR